MNELQYNFQQPKTESIVGRVKTFQNWGMIMDKEYEVKKEYHEYTNQALNGLYIWRTKC